MMTDPQAERLKQIKEREAKATKGPWFFESHYNPQIEMLVSAELANDDNRNDPVLMHGYTAPDSQIEANWNFVQEARADVPWLVEQLETAKAEIKRLEKSIEKGCDSMTEQREAEIRERATYCAIQAYAVLYNVLEVKESLPPQVAELSRRFAAFALSELSAAEKAERERCCKDMCYLCENPSISGAAELQNGAWTHGMGIECKASAIRNRTEG